MTYAAALALVLLTARVLGTAGRHVVLGWWSPVAYLWHDAALVLVFAVFERLARGRVAPTRAAYAIVSAYAVLNVPVERALSSPLTRAMWRAAGGPLADSIAHDATWPSALSLAAGVTVIVAAPMVARRLTVPPVLAGLVACVALGPIAAAHVDTQGRERNAWTALLGHVDVQPMAAAPRDWRSSALSTLPSRDLTRLRGIAARRNVVLVSLESTAARYLGLYGATEDMTPNLSRLAQSGVVFENAYAVYPESIKGLFSVLCSRAPAIDTPARAYAAVPCRSIAATLHATGYRTALFHSGRFGYLGMDAVIRDRGYDVLADAGDIGGARESSFGIDEPSTVASILRWLDAGPRGQPFFVTYLPIAGHHPYETPEPGPFPDREEFGRYRNAQHYGDAALGALRRGLEARGLDANTLWVVLGDHGEAFGQHDGNYGHTFQLFDENVHVPLVVAIPGLMSGPVRAPQVVSLIDTAPTILDLLGCAPSPAYEGRSMLEVGARTALFFTDYSLALAGVRDGPRKIIRDLRSGRSRWFDLERDPGETHDLSAAHAAEMRRYDEILDGWIAFTRSNIDHVR